MDKTFLRYYYRQRPVICQLPLFVADVAACTWRRSGPLVLEIGLISGIFGVSAILHPFLYRRSRQARLGQEKCLYLGSVFLRSLPTAAYAYFTSIAHADDSPHHPRSGLWSGYDLCGRAGRRHHPLVAARRRRRLFRVGQHDFYGHCAGFGRHAAHRFQLRFPLCLFHHCRGLSRRLHCILQRIGQRHPPLPPRAESESILGGAASSKPARDFLLSLRCSLAWRTAASIPLSPCWPRKSIFPMQASSSSSARYSSF